MRDWSFLLGTPKDKRKKLRPHAPGCVRHEGKRGRVQSPDRAIAIDYLCQVPGVCFVEGRGSQGLSP